MSAQTNLWRAKRLQHLANRALKMTQHYPALSKSAEHHFLRYRKLLRATLDAWQLVDVNYPLKGEQ